MKPGALAGSPHTLEVKALRTKDRYFVQTSLLVAGVEGRSLHKISHTTLPDPGLPW